MSLGLALVISLSTLLVSVPAPTLASPPTLNNGLALKPPMGWNSWNRFGCNVSDTMIRQMADAMVSSGMAAAGYQYVNVDDCWQGIGRTNGHVNLDSDFPNMKGLADYVHSKGLKFGLYSDRGSATCQGRVGSYGFETTDANDYATWGVDYLKYDNCNVVPGSNIQTDYTNMRNALANSGRAIVYSICAWHYETWMPSVGNLWRTTGDISDSWASMFSLPNANNMSASVAGPGAWNDPDMLEVGNGGMTDTEYRTHMGWWAVMAAPLIAGNDLRSMTQATKDILMAPEIIAMDQDALGKQGTRVWDGGNGQNIWSKVQSGTNVRAIFVLNGSTGTTSINVSWSQIGLPAGNATVRDLWSRTDLGTFNNGFTVSNIPPHGSRVFKIVSSGGGSGGPSGYTFCANENGTCSFSGGTASVAYGANGSFFYKSATGSIACNNATFGDPLVGIGKACYYKLTEAEAGTRSGAAVTASCPACSGGSKVGFIGNGSANYVTLTLNVASAGTKTMTIYYLVSGTRDFFVSVNGGAGVQKTLSGSSWSTPVSSTMNVTLNAGSNTIKFYNNSAYAPDLDRIVIP